MVHVNPQLFSASLENKQKRVLFGELTVKRQQKDTPKIKEFHLFFFSLSSFLLHCLHTVK